MLIGICGKAGSGKDTIGDYLVEQHGFDKIALADPIKRLVRDVFVLDDTTVNDRELREKPLDKWGGWSVRKLLQFIGTEMFRERIDEEIWVKSLWYRIKDFPEKNYVVTDMRFPNELDFFRYQSKQGKQNFVCLQVKRHGFEGKVGISGHRSESYDLKGDFEIINDSTIDNLHDKIDEILNKVMNPINEKEQTYSYSPDIVDDLANRAIEFIKSAEIEREMQRLDRPYGYSSSEFLNKKDDLMKVLALWRMTSHDKGGKNE